MTDPPQDLIAEKSVLGCMLMSAAAIPEVLEVAKADDFYRPAHATIFRVIVDLYTGGLVADATTVAAQLQEHGQLTKIGGAPYLLELLQTAPTADAGAQYARIVVDMATRRRLEQFGVRCQQLAHTGDADDIDEVIAQAEAFLREIRIPREKATVFSDLVLDWNTWIEADPTADVIPTPWSRLNELLSGGIHKQKLVVVGGRPAQGKSLSVLNIAAHAAENDKSVIIFSLEMPRNEVASRLLAAGAEVSFQQIIRRKLRQETALAIHNYAAQNAGMKLYCIDKPSLTVEQISAHCRAVEDLDLVVIDYAQLVKGSDTKLRRNEQVAHVSRTLKTLAKDMHIAVVLAAQLNRQLVDPKTGKARIPVLTDLGESSALEADADSVIFLHRPEPDEGNIDIIVSKNRSGLTGTVGLTFMGGQARLG